jgi:hypothetical protein
MGFQDRRRDILNRVASGELSILEANQQLADLESGQAVDDPVSSLAEPPQPVVQDAEPETENARVDSLPPEADDLHGEPVESAQPFQTPAEVFPNQSDAEMKQRVRRWQRLWVIPFGIGVAVTITGAYWMYLGWMAARASWGFWLSWFPFLLGLGLMVLALYSKSMPWLHLHVEDRHSTGSTNINLTLPIPLNVVSWGATHFDRYMPHNVRKQNLGEMISMFDQSILSDQPLHITVDDEDSRVEIAIFRPD